MRFEDLKRVWREEGTGEYKRAKIEDLSAAQRRASDLLKRVVRRRLGATGRMLLISIPLLSWAAINAPWPLFAWPGAVLCWSWFAYLFVSHWKVGRAKPDPGLPVRDAVHAELERFRMLERHFERRVLVFPLLVVGMICLFVGLSRDPQERLGIILTFSVVQLLFMAWARPRVRRNRERVVRPLREELESWARDLEEFEAEGRANHQNDAFSGGSS